MIDAFYKWREMSIIVDTNISDQRFLELFDSVLLRIPQEQVDEFPFFNLYRCRTDLLAYVLEDGLCFDLRAMAQYPETVQRGLIAHQLALKFLGYDGTSMADDHEEAGQLAMEWGFGQEHGS
jgi:hypothetical protein